MLHDFHAKNPTRKWNHICPNVPVHMIADWASEVVKFCRGQLEITSPCHEAEHLLSGKKNVIPNEHLHLGVFARVDGHDVAVDDSDGPAGGGRHKV